MSQIVVLIALALIIVRPAIASNILILGDSLSASYGMQASEGWVELVQQQLKQKKSPLVLHNFSASGETTAGGKVRLERLLATTEFDVLWIELGGNDGLRGYPIKTIRNNLLQMIKLAQQQQIVVIVSQIELPPNLGKRYIKMFSAIFADVTSQTGSQLMPFLIKDVMGDPDMMQADGIHPNRLAQPIIADFVLEYLQLYIVNIVH